jgi:hypothetical protein
MTFVCRPKPIPGRPLNGKRLPGHRRPLNGTRPSPPGRRPMPPPKAPKLPVDSRLVVTKPEHKDYAKDFKSALKSMWKGPEGKTIVHTLRSFEAE